MEKGNILKNDRWQMQIYFVNLLLLISFAAQLKQ